jgi:hypothetical protein
MESIMRNFSVIAPKGTTFQTYSINGNEYTQTSDQVYDKATTKLAAALGIDVVTLRDLVKDFAEAGSNDSAIWMQITPSQGEVIVRFATFILSVIQRENTSWIDYRGGTQVFTYTNLNSGAVFVWVDFVDG